MSDVEGSELTESHMISSQGLSVEVTKYKQMGDETVLLYHDDHLVGTLSNTYTEFTRELEKLEELTKGGELDG